jgi:undecaprenyl-diphosphatase
MNNIFIFGAKYLFIVSPLIAGIYFLMQSRLKQKRMLILGIVAVVSTYIVVLISSHIFINPRPFVVTGIAPLIPHIPDNGFPSDHAVFTAVIASIMYFFNKKIGITLLLISIIVSISRVYVGVHHPIDVIGGILIAIIMTSLSYMYVNKYLVK